MSDEEYDFEYSDDEQEEEDVNIENHYYNAKELLEDNVDEALKGFNEARRPARARLVASRPRRSPSQRAGHPPPTHTLALPRRATPRLPSESPASAAAAARRRW